jgi:CopA family copper-resistance protein
MNTFISHTAPHEPNQQAATEPAHVSRRRFVLGASTSLALSSLPISRLTQAEPAPSNTPVLSGTVFELAIGYQTVNFTGQKRIATTVNGCLPGPTLRWKEGERVTLRVTNNLKEDSSIHWHGIILPSSMDGSPGFDSEPIKPGATFEYQFDVKQCGTYWYHSHSGFQEQTGLLGAIVIEPKEPDPVVFDREMTVQLSDWSDEAPQVIYAKLKKRSHYYNFRERTLGDTWRDIKTLGLSGTLKARSMWNQMRMSERDIADVTGYTYTYLMNGMTPDRGWTGLYKAGERVRLRIINGAAMTFFDIRIPGLKMTVVAADGQNIKPVTVDEFRIAPAETYDVLITPDGEQAYCLFAQTIDRSGYARGTLTPNVQLTAAVPAMDPAPNLTHQDMGMGGMDHSGHDMGEMDMKAMDHSGHDMSKMDMKSMDHSGHDMSKMDTKPMDHSGHTGHTGNAAPQPKRPPLAKAGFGSNIGDCNVGKNRMWFFAFSHTSCFDRFK